MGGTRIPREVVPICGAIFADESKLAAAKELLVSELGPISQTSPVYPFVQTDYYRDEMGEDLRRLFWAFEPPRDPGELPDWKLASNRIENELANAAGGRTVNLDPGYVAREKLVLASTKNYGHRIYLRDGIYAEVTLTYRQEAWRHYDYSFPEYRRPDYHVFFTKVRGRLVG